MTDSDRKIITHAITRMLSRREHSSQEVYTKLSQKGFASEDFIPVVQGFLDADILSDSRYAQMRVRACAAKGVGTCRIRAELKQQHISEQLIDDAVVEAEVDWFALAKQVKQKKFGQQKESDFKLRQKQMQFLHYRGFTQEQIQYAVCGD
ncbi:regulatory protein RecX [Alteromonas sp. C1M14]|uniref:regulatory protein RecX n=1 Tax=Alteromonas sp. C1M14 TaxID=2841567 RepID=UPI001C0911FE|nr:regulatory protein RecX [Alteromonas sp. C1M14]MBU2978002.1 recombination regulator RecX [Alteromonas sp. C1M14]